MKTILAPTLNLKGERIVTLSLNSLFCPLALLPQLGELNEVLAA